MFVLTSCMVRSCLKIHTFSWSSGTWRSVVRRVVPDVSQEVQSWAFHITKTAATFRPLKVMALLSVETSGSCSSEYRTVSQWRLQVIFVFTIWYDMIWYMIWYDMIWYDMIWYDMIWYDIFNCIWVVTRWQYFSTHIHTNNTENVTKHSIHRTTQNT